jgi:hypothetical protein
MNALELAKRAGCEVDVIVAAELGTRLPLDQGIRQRLAEAYGLSLPDFLALALDSAQRWEDTHWKVEARPGKLRKTGI